MADDQVEWLLATILGSDLSYRVTGLHYSRVDVSQLADRLTLEFGCDHALAMIAAASVLANHVYSEMIRAGFKSSKSDPNAGRKVSQELKRLVKVQRPQESALQVSDAADIYVTQALSNRGEYRLMRRWLARETLTSKEERIDLVRECGPAAHEAWSRLNQMTKLGRPADHAYETFIAEVTGIFHTVLDIKPTANPRTRCRQVLEICADHCDLPRRDLCDAGVRSALAERAIEMYKSRSLSFHGAKIRKLVTGQ